LLYYKEGLDAVVAVRMHGDNRSLVINGKADASSVGDLPTQVLLGQLPLALDRNPENALIIGLGSGITAGSLTVHESLKKMTILEISDEVIEASDLFAMENYGVLKDPRVDLVTADARNHLMATSDRYDLIVSQPSNPWISGISNLFTDEFFKLAKSRLNAGGIVSQWVQTYRMSNDDLKTILNTFQDNFQYVSLWMPMVDDLIIIGSDQPHALSMGYTNDDQATKMTAELRRARVFSFRDLVRLYILGGDTLSNYVKGADANTDNHPVIEFNAPRNLYRPTSRQNMAHIFQYLGGRKYPVPLTGLAYQSTEYLAADFMRLKIGKDDGQDATGLMPRWLIHWQPIETSEGWQYGVSGERVLTWQEGGTAFYIKAIWGSKFPSLKNLLENTIRSTGRQGGDIQLPGGVDAVWLAGNNDGSPQIQIELLWDCPAQHSGYTRYALSVSQADPGEEEWSNVLATLAGRFHCE
jgi:spermidine synthase